MSYILDALRKSDQQRQRGVPPTLLAPQAAEPVRGRSMSLSQGLLVAMLIGIGIAIGSLRPWYTEQAPPATAAVVNKSLESSSSPSPPLAVLVQPGSSGKAEQRVPAPKTASVVPPAQKSAPEAMERTVPAVAKSEAGSTAPNRRPDVASVVATDAAKPSLEKRDAVALGDAMPEQKTVPITELPASIRDEMPKMSISVHAYSKEPKDRLVGINDRVLHEGESLSPGLTIEQITPDGLIMSYKGYRFQRGVR